MTLPNTIVTVIRTATDGIIIEAQSFIQPKATEAECLFIKWVGDAFYPDLIQDGHYIRPSGETVQIFWTQLDKKL